MRCIHHLPPELSGGGVCDWEGAWWGELWGETMFLIDPCVWLSFWTHGFKCIWCVSSHGSYCPYWHISHLVFGQWVLFKLAPESFWHSPTAVDKNFLAHLVYFLPLTSNQHVFFKNSGLFLWKMIFKDLNLGTRLTHCCWVGQYL